MLAVDANPHVLNQFKDLSHTFPGIWVMAVDIIGCQWLAHVNLCKIEAWVISITWHCMKLVCRKTARSETDIFRELISEHSVQGNIHKSLLSIYKMWAADSSKLNHAYIFLQSNLLIQKCLVCTFWKDFLPFPLWEELSNWINLGILCVALKFLSPVNKLQIFLIKN